MLKLPITDPAIRIVPSKDLKQYIGSKIEVSSSTPQSVRDICAAFNTAKRTGTKLNGNPVSKAAIETVQFTAPELKVIGECIAAKSDPMDETLQQPCGLDFDDAKEVATSAGLGLSDVKWLYATLNQMRQSDKMVPYLHTLLQGCQLVLPQNPEQERNPVLEERCKLLRKQQEDRDYHRMTKNVDSIRRHMPEETIAYQMKQINRHLIAVAQFLFSVAAGFAFGFIGIALIVGEMDFGVRLMLGIIIALIIALAEIYFLAKRLNAEYDLAVPPPMAAPKEMATKVVESVSIEPKPKRGPKKKQHKD
ncbi:uncharacterized protein LOC131216351 [Anopheles bellator]|uniref:uncharacterized protein LOC131216351 n=1 Tax=Anopheles bellator TaxID=139047 RepID=UPI00264715F4|nr:uncharacterized protein LOC131216351 [Anopheles bellator]XP_058066801.1 uncharacterized protein LOC131216351 [Anopheles bellator]